MDHMSDSCELNLPYPAIKTEGRNPYFAALLMQDYAGRNSEMTAINQYFYQHLIVTDENRRLAETLECISIVEMHHLHILGELIVLLGGNPQFRTDGRRGYYWRGDYVSYTQNIRRFLENNITAERNAISAYKIRYRQITDDGVRKNLERIILDEEHHIELFEHALKEYT